MVLTANRIFQPTILLALSLMAVIAMMILPMPAWVLDIGLMASFALAILIFTITLFIEEPLDFSSFPTVLLASLMLRLSLNVSSTKLIIGQGHTGTSAAGDVIEGFAMFVMGGSIFLGLVVFGVLLIVNFIVITKGAARMAEVGARFALDGMPGKQLAIDSDMSAGAIDHAEAKRRRERDQAETTFFGSLDGASKFVKGDAVAGLLITLLNIVMGLAMGVIVHGMPIGTAFKTYAILTVGDGLVTQIPAVIISIASALLLARGGATGSTDVALMAQFGKHPAALATVAVLLGLFGMVPGLPLVPFILGAAALGAVATLLMRRAGQQVQTQSDVAPADAPAPEARIGDVIDLDDIHLEFARNLVPMVLDPSNGLEARIDSIRRHVAAGYGIILPEIRLTDDDSQPTGEYVIRIQGAEQARGRVEPGMLLALVADEGGALPPGTDVKEPVFGAAARWISEIDREQAAMAGCTLVTPTEVLATHLMEVLKKNLSRLLTLKSMRKLLDELTSLSDSSRAEANRRMLDELVPDKVPLGLLLSVLKLLLAERVSIRNLPLILEAIAEVSSAGLPAATVCEHVRQRLGFQLVAENRRQDGTLPIIQLAPEWEDVFAEYTVETDGFSDVALPPGEFNRLAEALGAEIGAAASRGQAPVIATSGPRRRFIASVLAAKGYDAPVLSYEEIGAEARPALVGRVAA